MQILILSANKPLFLEFKKTFRFIDNTVNTCYLYITEPTFIKLRNWLRDKGYNPFSVMSW